jgi:hypothetical protein
MTDWAAAETQLRSSLLTAVDDRVRHEVVRAVALDQPLPYPGI